MRLNIEMKKIENNYCLEYNNGSVLFCSVLFCSVLHENLSPVNYPKPEIFLFGCLLILIILYSKKLSIAINLNI